MLRTFRMVASPTKANIYADDFRRVTTHGMLCIDVVLRGSAEDGDAVTPIVRVFLDVDCNLIGSWVDEGTERESVTFSVAP